MDLKKWGSAYAHRYRPDIKTVMRLFCAPAIASSILKCHLFTLPAFARAHDCRLTNHDDD